MRESPRLPKGKRRMRLSHFAVLGAVPFLGLIGVSGESFASTSYPTGHLSQMTDTVVASSTNAIANGDTNPYGIAVIPKTEGNLVAGNLLVADFNSSGGTSGAGTSIVQINPMTGATTDFVTAASLGSAAYIPSTTTSYLTGPVEIAINPANDVVWIASQGPSGANSSYLVVSSSGTFLDAESTASVTTSGSYTNPFAGVWGGAFGNNGTKNSFYWTNIAGTASGAGAGEIWRTDPGTPSLNANSTFVPLAIGLPASEASLTGPKGMAYDAANDTLYVTDSQNNTVYAIAHASTLTSPVTPTVVYQGGPLNVPQDIAIDPATGSLFVVNGNGSTGLENGIVEMTTSGVLLGVRDLAPSEAVGGLFGIAATTTASGTPVLYYDNANDSNLHSLSLAPSTGIRMVASDGGIFNFGSNATYYGSTGGMTLNKPIVGMASTPDGKGYWLVGADGGIFTFGDATYYGSEGGTKLNAPIVGMASTPDGKGYWLVGADGGIFTFGDASYYGSTGAMTLNKPIVGMAPTTDGKGYALIASDGGVFNFGDATYYGSLASMALNKPIVGGTFTE